MWLRGLRLAAASLLALQLTPTVWAQDDVDPNCAAAGIYDYDGCSAYLSGGDSEPVYEEPAYEEPAYEEPAYEEPAYEEPAYEEPAYEEPAYEEEPAQDEPAVDEPTYDDEQVIEQEPQEQQDVFDDQVEDDTFFDEPAAEEETSSEDAIVDDQGSDEEFVEDDTSAGDDFVDEETTPADEVVEDDAIAEDDAADQGEQLFTAEEAESFDAEPLVEDGGVQEEVIEDLPEDVSAEDIAPALDSLKEYEGDAEPEAPEFVPTDDATAQVFEAPEFIDPVEGEDATLLEAAPETFAAPEGVTVIDNSQNTVIYEVNNTTVINNYYEDQQRLAYGADAVEYYSYADGSYSESVIAGDGSQVITIRDAYGNIISRTYYDEFGNEYVLAWYDPSYREDERMYWYDVGYDLPPLLVTVPRGDYIFFYDRRDEAALSRFFQLPPVEPIRRLYTIDEVKRSARLRDSLPRVEIGDLTFATGSATINRNQARTLEKLATAMLAAIKNNPAETFLIEGHTDAPGSERDNLRLSDARAAAVARALTEYFGVPAWNITTQGYGERYLKVQTTAANPNNRRVTIRRITPLVTTANR